MLSTESGEMGSCLQVGLPYIKAKLDKLFHRHRRSVEGVLGLPLLPPPEVNG